MSSKSSDEIAIEYTVGLFSQGFTALFVYLHCTGAIAWAWYWLISPLWIPLVFALLMLLVGAMIVGARGR